MKQTLRIGGGILAALILVWLGAGALIWSRNNVPAPPAPSRELPANNVYGRYVELVTSVKDQKLLQRLHLNPDASRSDIERVLADNRAVLDSLRDLAGKPCAVTELQPGEQFVGALAFPGVTRLAALSARITAKRDPRIAIGDIVAGLHFGTGVMRKGATLHVTTSFLSLVPLFMDAPAVVPLLNASQCTEAARQIRGMLDQQTPISEIMANERAVRLAQLARTVRPGATSVFRLKLPLESYERDFLLRPKRPAYDALDRYMQAWIAESKKPLSAVTPPEGPKELEGIMADESLEPRNMGVHLMRHAYITARLRILHAALLLEARRKATGVYPASLKGLAPDQYLADPFSNDPLVYRSRGSRYDLYSVGPNGTDDGGMSYAESKMSPDQAGDLPLKPTF
jgi:hypothetical protein